MTPCRCTSASGKLHGQPALSLGHRNGGHPAFPAPLFLPMLVPVDETARRDRDEVIAVAGFFRRSLCHFRE